MVHAQKILIKQFKLRYFFKLFKFIYITNKDKEIIKYYQYFYKSKYTFLFMVIKLFYIVFLFSFKTIGKILFKRYLVIFIVCHEHNIIGLAHIEFNGSQGYHNGLLGIVLIRHIFGMGVGRKLLESCIDYCAKKNKTKIELDVFADNTRAISLYRKVGFIYTKTTNTENIEYHMELNL